MKRAASYEDTRIAKKLRISEDPFDVALECSVQDLYRSDTNGTGFIRAKVFMIWPTVNGQLRIQVRVAVESRQVGFEVTFSGHCAEYFIQKKKPSTSPTTFPISLRYVEGAVVKFIKTVRWGDEERVVDTWKLKAEEPDWFKSPSPADNVNEVVSKPEFKTTIPHKRVNTPISSRTPSSEHSSVGRQSPPSRTVVDLSDDAQAQEKHKPRKEKPAVSPPAQESSARGKPPRAVKMSKRQKKVERLAQRHPNGAPAKETTGGTSAEEPILHPPTRVNTPAANSSIRPEEPAKVDIEANNASKHPDEPGPNPPATSTVANASTKLAELRAGFTNDNGDKFSPLADLKRLGAFYNVIGVVVRCTPAEKSRTGEFTCTISIVDPTCYSTISYDLTPSEGFIITCFTKRYKEWLPAAAKHGDILILSRLKTSEWNGSMRGTGLGNRLSWAIYSPASETTHHGHFDTSVVPLSEGADNGFGLKISPFHNPTAAEIAYCKGLSHWWEGVVRSREEAQKEVTVVGNYGGEIYQRPSQRSSRVHRLISDAHPDAPPSGYFDCTVEVLYGMLNDSGPGVYSLFVTDYTANSALYPVQADWAPSDLTDSILKIEMWDDAASMGPTMVQGQYYSMKNVRAKVNTAGYLEAKIVETKMSHMGEGETDMHLKALLERKKAWQQNSSSTDGTRVYPHQLLQDIQDGQRFTCTVEVLYVDSGSHGSNAFIYVTDYTSNPMLTSCHPLEAWASNLAGQVLKVQLSDGQAATGKRLETGSFCQLRNVRVKSSHTTDGIRGYLGGEQRLIMKLQRESEDEQLKSLLARKDTWSGQFSTNVTKLPLTTNVPAPLSLPTLAPSRQKPYVSIQKGKAGSSDFYVLGRVIDFWPSDVEDFVLLYCSNCRTNIPKSQKACLECVDMDHEFVQFHYRFFLRLQDEEGGTLDVVITHKSLLLNQVKLADLHEDASAVKSVLDCLAPYIGNLVQVHDSWTKGTRLVINTPYFYWKVTSKALPLDDGSPLVYYLIDVNECS
ncbi:Protection of telomeres protein 1 [Pleurotus pulmonarius]